ncbi:uncharacterized protein LOC105443494 [Strongylocentrotus purpuratus]|uniref:Uncharacterized protein n=1 Tax=Strongylocentrotus purpuratus TaxID=7668 RepID=A0A7M7P2W3_STRPU|nr:uncharacterized protein LOC105443494 [Strongylocentrotus purpuratus]|eukprot:XP_011675029.1 PREDICTED: uncharacterized protein LOC105443494 [Strongylocentrotus purpuratus]
MPRTRSSKKPGCFNQVKPTLMFTESPAEKLPRRLCSPTNAADNPITAQVLYLEDGLETTWVSPQFHPAMLDMEEAPKGRRRKKQNGDITGKSAMETQHTKRKRRPVRKSSSTTPIPSEKRFPKGFQPLHFLGDASRNGRDGDQSWRRMVVEDEDDDVRIDDGDDDDGVWLEDSTVFRKEQRTTRRGSSTKSMLQRFEDEEEMETGVHDYSKTLHDASHRLRDQGRVKTGRSSVTRSKTSSVRGWHDNKHHSYRDGDVDEGNLHHSRLTALREKPLTSNTHQRHLTSNHPHDLSVSPDENFSRLDDIRDWGPGGKDTYGQSPQFHQNKRKARGGAARKKLEQFAAESHQFLDTEDQNLFADLNRTGQDGLETRGKVLAADTPVSDYGLRVTLRRRRQLLPKHYTERLLLDS